MMVALCPTAEHEDRLGLMPHSKGINRPVESATLTGRSRVSNDRPQCGNDQPLKGARAVWTRLPPSTAFDQLHYDVPSRIEMRDGHRAGSTRIPYAACLQNALVLDLERRCIHEQRVLQALIAFDLAA